MIHRYWRRLALYSGQTKLKMKKITVLCCWTLLFLHTIKVFGQKPPKYHGRLETLLFQTNHPSPSMVVAFGGSEGGHTFASEKTATVREQFSQRGFHFLSIAYFGEKKLPKTIDRISLQAIQDTITAVRDRLGITPEKTILLGASRGGELVLNLASYYQFGGVIAMVPANVTIPSYAGKQPTSSWMAGNKEVPFISLDEQSIHREGWHNTLLTALSTIDVDDPAHIPVEQSQGFVLLTSGKSDALWPSFEMCEALIRRLEQKGFPHPFKHQAYVGGHNPSGHWKEVFQFLDQVTEVE